MSKNKLKTVPKVRWDTMKALAKNQIEGGLPEVDYFIVTRPPRTSASRWKSLCEDLSDISIGRGLACCISESDKKCTTVKRTVKRRKLLCSATGERQYCTHHGEPVALIDCDNNLAMPVCEHHLMVHLSHSGEDDFRIVKWLKTDFRG